MGCVPAPACKAMLAEATHLWPTRSQASDGICASPKHTSQNPTSDHELGNAVDLTDDPSTGCYAHRLAELVRLNRDPRVKYIISRSRIAGPKPVASYPAWAWRPYSGSNPHDKHAHFSIHASARGDTSPWFATTPQEATMTFALDGTAAVQPMRRDAQGRVAFWGWRKDGSVFAFNGAPGPIPNTAAKTHIGTVTALLPDAEGGYFLVGGEPGEGSTWGTYRSSEFPPEWRA